jgi:hypothetical protein
MSKTKNLVQLLDSTEKSEFDKVVKAYLKAEYDFNKIVFTDGINDTGLDIKVFDYKGQSLQFQLTTQKSKTKAELNAFEKKLIEDLEKAKENHTNYKYSNKLIFFYSKEFTNLRIRNYEKLAFKNYGIDLELIEANRLAEESENIIEIQRILLQISELDKFNVNESIFDNEKENLVYDLLSFGKPSEFKLQIIEAFILTSLFTKKQLTKDEIIKLCEDKFKVKENSVFYDKLVNRLLTTKQITKSEDKSTLLLSGIELSNLTTKIEQYELDEKVFLRDIKQILEKHSQEILINEYVGQLKQLYINNFNSDLHQIVNHTDDTKLFSVIKEFLQFIESTDAVCESPKILAKELLSYCIESKFIQKIAASKVYCENINNTRLQNYLITQKKIFIDTSIALNALCYFYKPKTSFNNYFYKMSKSLIEFAKKENLELNISERYIWEVQNHVKDSFKILPFSRIENFSKLGSSKNIFYNFYMFLAKNDTLDDDISFDIFLDNFGFGENFTSKSTNSKISSYLDKMNIKMVEFEYDYEIEETNKLFESQLIKNNKFKSPFTLSNDSIMLEYLAHNDTDVHPVSPIFVTWDKTFFDVQKEYTKKYPDAQKWLMLPPSKLIDSYAILKFEIDGETVTENLLALISDDLFQSTNALIDTVKFILNPDDEIGLEYTNKLAEIREKEITDINNKVSTPPESFEGEAIIDDVVFNLSNYFQEKENSNDFELFKEIFTKKEFMPEVIISITCAISDFYKSHKIENKFYETFDKLVDKIKLEKSA